MRFLLRADLMFTTHKKARRRQDFSARKCHASTLSLQCIFNTPKGITLYKESLPMTRFWMGKSSPISDDGAGRSALTALFPITSSIRSR